MHVNYNNLSPITARPSATEAAQCGKTELLTSDQQGELPLSIRALPEWQVHVSLLCTAASLKPHMQTARETLESHQTLPNRSSHVEV